MLQRLGLYSTIRPRGRPRNQPDDRVHKVLTRVAGFAWGTGFYINPVPP